MGNLVIIGSLAIFAAVGYLFWSEWRLVGERQERVVELRRVAEEEGACAAFVSANSLLRAAGSGLDYDSSRDLKVLRRRLAKRIVSDNAGRAALIKGSEQGLVSEVLCEQIAMSESVGEPHPVMALLRFMREQNPCQEALALDRVLRGLGSHRALLMRGLMQDVGRLSCLSPAMAEEVARNAAQLLRDDPQVFDDLHVGRIAGFIVAWAPLAGAQTGCVIDALNSVSHLGSVIGCSPDQRDRVLPRYRLNRALAKRQGLAGLPAGSEVLLLGEAYGRCQIRPAGRLRRIDEVRCADLKLISDLDIAVLIEPIRYGQAEADLISGLATYAGRTNTIASTTGHEPRHHSWFAYNRDGEALGATVAVSFAALAKQAGVSLPAAPLRSFCRASGAKFCYDVDWTQVVAKVPGHRTIFLSRPMDVFLRDARLSEAAMLVKFNSAFGRPPRAEAKARVFAPAPGAWLLLEQTTDGLSLRWRTGEGPWRAQEYGAGEGPAVNGSLPAARLLAAMDLQGDGEPELAIQRSMREMRDGKLSDVTDEVHLLHLVEGQQRFETLTQLTVHEY